MIKVKEIREENKIISVTLKISGGDDFWDDLGRVKSIPSQDRDYRIIDKQKIWVISHADNYMDIIPEMKSPIKEHKLQLRFF